MSEMIERVSSAIPSIVIGHSSRGQWTVSQEIGDEWVIVARPSSHTEAIAERGRIIARACIAAMREPTEAISKINGSVNWPAMIDALLE